MVEGFKKFILRGNVVDLAVGVIVGAAFNSVVQSLVKDLITPFIAAIGGKHDFSNLYFTLNNSKFMYGDFINVLISFLIIAAVVYFFIVTPMNKLVELTKGTQKPEDPATKKCPECLSIIPAKAKRCMYCTSILSSKKVTRLN